jgi:hypothetical protein
MYLSRQTSNHRRDKHYDEGDDKDNRVNRENGRKLMSQDCERARPELGTVQVAPGQPTLELAHRASKVKGVGATAGLALASGATEGELSGVIDKVEIDAHSFRPA